MRWYKFAIVLAAGLLLEVSIAAISCFLIQANGTWVKSLALPYFAPRSAVFYGVLMEIVYLCSALSLGFFTETRSDFPKGFLLTAAEGISQIVLLSFFFELTYEIVSFFLATITMLLSFYVTAVFLKKNDLAGLFRLPVFQINVYFWAVIYCVLTINFT